MAMRMSGLISGMDTESLIGQLVEARSAKVNKTKKAQIKLNWQQDAWKELNTKLKNLQSKFVSTMRFSTAYTKKTTKVSNSSAVSVITGEDAVEGVQSLKISQLAKTGYLTGAELKKDGAKGDYSAMTKLSELNGMEPGESGTFSINTQGKSYDVKVNSETTISEVLNQLKDAGLNASFDAKSQRLFISAKESGAANDFSLTASDKNGANALAALGIQTKISAEDNLATWNRYAALTKKENGVYVGKSLDDLKDEVDKTVNSRKDSYLNQYKSVLSSLKSLGIQNEDDIEEKLNGTDGLRTQIDRLTADIDELEDGEEKDLRTAALKDLQKQVNTLEAAQDKIAEVKEYVDIIPSTADDGSVTYSAEATRKLKDEVNAGFTAKADYAAEVMNAPSLVGSGEATKVNAQDAVIMLNGAKFTNSSNVFEINGLTFTALAETGDDDVTVTTQQDTDGVYDLIKNFLKEYNSIINEMDKLYNATSAKGYDPLLSEEKEAMSETEVTEYEKKIKDALLRRDSNLSTVSTALKGIMSSGFEVNGTKMYLADFGISTLGYFSAPDNEKNAYHIDGDPDDGDTSGNADKLKGLIASDPDAVISFFTQLSRSLYGKMSDLSKSVDGYRSFGSFYDDKKMKSDYESYTSKIKTLEDKLNDYEDRWYSKFSKMETAMAKMQKNTNALSGLLGGS